MPKMRNALPPLAELREGGEVPLSYLLKKKIIFFIWKTKLYWIYNYNLAGFQLVAAGESLGRGSGANNQYSYLEYALSEQLWTNGKSPFPRYTRVRFPLNARPTFFFCLQMFYTKTGINPCRRTQTRNLEQKDMGLQPLS